VSKQVGLQVGPQVDPQVGPHTHLVTYLELRTEAKVDAHLDPLVAWVQGVVDPSWGHTWDLVPLDRDLLEESYGDLYKAQKDHYDKARVTRFKFVEAQKPTEISVEQLKEWNDAFDHFDVNNNNYLEFDEFSAALKAVGVPLTEEAELVKFKELKKSVKPEDSPTAVDCVDRDNFTEFLKQMYTADDTAESVLASMDSARAFTAVSWSNLVPRHLLHVVEERLCRQNWWNGLQQIEQ